MTITEFLLARIAEDEAAAEVAIAAEVATLWRDGMPDVDRDQLLTMESDHWRRPLAECDAKRRIVEYRLRLDRSASDDEYTDGRSEANYAACYALASVYAGHPDYDEAWRPS